MRRGFKKIIALSLIATLVYSYFTGITAYSSEEILNEKTTNISDLQYEKKENSITIIGYTGNEEKLNLPDKIEDMEVTNISDNAFKGSKIKEIKMPFIKEIGEGAFLDCTTLEKIEISNEVSVKANAFKGTSINEVTVNYKETKIEDKTIEDWNAIIKNIDGINLENVTGKFIKNNEYTKNLNDTVGPIITLNGDAEINIEIGSAFIDLGATAYDEFEKVDTVVTSDGVVDTTKLGQYILTYKAIDSSKNISTVTRKVNVVDTIAPEIALNGDAEIVIEAGQRYEELGAIGIDKVDGEIKVTISGEVNTSKIGEYKLTYTVTDSSGNKAVVIRKVKVVDTTAPIIIFNGDKEITIEAGTQYVEPGASGKDTVDGRVEVKISGVIDTGKVGEYKINYTTSDKSGNKASAVRKIKVVDTVAPIITLNGDSTINLEVGNKYEELGAVAKDKVDGMLAVTITGDVDINKAGEYTITYKSVDNSKNESTTTRKVKVTEKIIEEDKNDAIKEDKSNNKLILIGVIGGVIILCGVTAGVIYYKRKNR